MAFISTKLMFLEFGMEENLLAKIKNIFPFQVYNIDKSFKCLGYYLDPNNYHKYDWWWLLRKVEKRIGHWCNKWLSLKEDLYL